MGPLSLYFVWEMVCLRLRAWFSTALDIEEVLARAGGDQLHVIVADVIESLWTLLFGPILDCSLERLGLPSWFRKVHFSFNCQVRLRFKLAAGSGEFWCRDGSIPQGCPLSMVSKVALYVPWCRRLEAMPCIKPHLYADNLKCSAVCPNALLGAARFTAQYVRSVGQDVSPGKCVLLSTSKAGQEKHEAMERVGGMASLGRWSLMCKILEVILTSLGELGWDSFLLVREATHGVAAVGALPLAFKVKFGLVRGKHLPAGLHAAEASAGLHAAGASYISVSSLSAFLAAIVRSVLVL